MLLQLSSRQVPRNSVTMQTLANWRKTSHKRERERWVRNSRAYDIVVHRTQEVRASEIIDKLSAILHINKDNSFACKNVMEELG